MNAAAFSITRRTITKMFIFLTILGGIVAYQNIGRLEDPEFTIKEALVVTYYPGATPKEVDNEVTDIIEKAANQLSQIKRIKSISMPGYSEVSVEIQDKYDKNGLPQVWDELRRKISDAQSSLPKGAGPSIVYDDFGDVFGMYYALTGKGFSYQELEEVSEIIEKGVLLVPGVAKVSIAGIRKQAIFVEISRSKMAQLGISLDQIYQTLHKQNLVVPSGSAQVGDEYIRIQPTGEIVDVESIKNLLVYSPKTKKLIHLDTIANIHRDYVEVPKQMNLYNGQPALTFGVSIAPGNNVVKVGKQVIDKLTELATVIPVGVQVHPIYEQPKLVDQSVQGFVINVVEALIIVLVVLLVAMGLSSGIIIGVILLLTVMGTLFFMYAFGIQLERISLGALIIALGMMVDNAIVVVEGILIKAQQGVQVAKAAIDTVNQTQVPLFGSTFVGILAFAAIGLSQDSTGEYTRSLFYVILISLTLSWVLAISVAPLLCDMLIKPSKPKEGDAPTQEQYTGIIYRIYQPFLENCLRRRVLTMGMLGAMLAASIYGFNFIKPGFFPDSTTPLFFINYWRDQGTDIRRTRDDISEIDKKIRSIQGVTDVAAIIGGAALRFTLVYNPEKPNGAYGQFIIRVDDYHKIPEIEKQVLALIKKEYPQSQPMADRIKLGTSKGAKIEVRFLGPDAAQLRKLSDQAQAIMHANPESINIRDDWRARVKIVEPVYSDKNARQTGISRERLSDALQTAFSGKQVGVFRERNKLIPIISRPPDFERLNIASIDDLQIWSPLHKTTVPIGQLVSKFNTKWEDDIIRRRYRKLTITAQCDPENIPAGTLLDQIMPKINAIPLPSGYSREWGGEYESSNDAQTALAKNLPAGFLAMIVIVVMLFDSVRQPLIIWLSVPLAIIGVTAGLLITNNAFEFMALLGFLSLTGMLIKNAVVLIDQIDLEVEEGKPIYRAIVDSCLSRVRPVSLAALTTVLGMIPLLQDAFFRSMAVTIMFGLSFATGLTLIVVPVLYAIFFRAKSDESSP